MHCVLIAYRSVGFACRFHSGSQVTLRIGRDHSIRHFFVAIKMLPTGAISGWGSVILPYNLRARPSWWRRKGCRSGRQLVTGLIIRKQRNGCCCSGVFLCFYTVHGMQAFTVKVGLPTLVSLECLLDDSRTCQVDKQYQWSSSAQGHSCMFLGLLDITPGIQDARNPDSA